MWYEIESEENRLYKIKELHTGDLFCNAGNAGNAGNVYMMLGETSVRFADSEGYHFVRLDTGEIDRYDMWCGGNFWKLEVKDCKLSVVKNGDS